jgi:hypothetical protein
LYLLNHGSHLAKRDLDTPTAALLACLHCPFLAALAFTFRAKNIPSERKFGHFAFVEVFQSNMYAMNEVFRLPLISCWAATAEKSATAKASSSAKELTE